MLLATLMAGTVLREAIRLEVPNGGNPKPFPALLLRVLKAGRSAGVDSVVILLAGLAVVLATHLVITRTRLGLPPCGGAGRWWAQLAGVSFNRTVLGTFALGSMLAASRG